MGPIRRMLARVAGRTSASVNSGLESGRMARRLSNWVPSRVHVNTLISQSGSTTLARARYLVRNNSYAANAVECFAANLIGAGIKPSWVLEKGQEELKKKGQELWLRWTDEADAEGVTDFYGLQRRIGRELFIAGECFVRLRPRYLSDGLSVPLQLQVLPSEMLPVNYFLQVDNGNWVRQGIEFDKIGRRVAYWFWRDNPGDSTIEPKTGDIVRIPASSILHIYDPVEGGQIRGLSKLTPSIVPLWMIDGYDDGELERKRVTACHAGAITSPEPEADIIDPAAEKKAREDGTGIADVAISPGMMQRLKPGESITFSSPTDSGPNYEAFQYRQLTRVIAGMGLPYAGVTGDLKQTTYGSQRAAMVDTRRRCEAQQHSIMVFQMCRPVWENWQDQAVLAGALDMPGYASDPNPYRNVTWIPPRWDWIDPLKDRQAEVIAVNAGFKARSQVIEAEGYDAAEIDERIAEDEARAKSLGITFLGTKAAKALVAETPPENIDQANPADAPAQPTATGVINGHAT